MQMGSFSVDEAMGVVTDDDTLYHRDGTGNLQTLYSPIQRSEPMEIPQRRSQDLSDFTDLLLNELSEDIQNNPYFSYPTFGTSDLQNTDTLNRCSSLSVTNRSQQQCFSTRTVSHGAAQPQHVESKMFSDNRTPQISVVGIAQPKHHVQNIEFLGSGTPQSSAVPVGTTEPKHHVQSRVLRGAGTPQNIEHKDIETSDIVPETSSKLFSHPQLNRTLSEQKVSFSTRIQSIDTPYTYSHHLLEDGVMDRSVHKEPLLSKSAPEPSMHQSGTTTTNDYLPSVLYDMLDDGDTGDMDENDHHDNMDVHEIESLLTAARERRRKTRSRLRVSESSPEETSQDYQEFLKNLQGEERKRELNRLAAKRCRRKKEQAELALEKKAKELRNENARLKEKRKELQEQIEWNNRK